MKISENILYALSKRWTPVLEKRNKKIGDDFKSDEYGIKYALLQQYGSKVRNGLSFDITNKKILEIGCGHGGISLFMALNGAKEVAGIDMDEFRLKYAFEAQKKLEEELGIAKGLNIKFRYMNAEKLEFENDSFDIVLAENVFEHIMKPIEVMNEVKRVLKKNGKLIIPIFVPYYSKYGAHLKQGLKVPWSNIFFSEKTIVNVMKRLCNENPKLKDLYVGVNNNPKEVRDLRRYKDLNYITHKKFKQYVNKTGFRLESLKPIATPFLIGKAIGKIPVLKNSILTDIFAIGTSAVLTKV